MIAGMQYPYFHVTIKSQETPKRQYPQSAKLLSNKFLKCYFNAFKKHWSKTGAICLNVIQQTWDMLWYSELTKLNMFFMTRSMTFFSLTVFVISRLVFFLIRRQSSEGVLWNKLRSKLATKLKTHCVTDVFLGTWPKFKEQLF